MLPAAFHEVVRSDIVARTRASFVIAWMLHVLVVPVGGMALASTSLQRLPFTLTSHVAGEHVTIATTKITAPSGSRGFEASSLYGRTRKQFVLASVIEHPRQLVLLSPSRAVLLGDVDWNVQALTIFDPQTTKIIVQFYCEAPVLSPDGAEVAFVRFYPQHFVPVAVTSAVYMFLNLRSGLGVRGDEPQDVIGTRVYPFVNPPARGWEVHRIGAPLHWLDRSTFVIVDSYRGLKSRLLVDVSGSHFARVVERSRAVDGSNSR